MDPIDGKARDILFIAPSMTSFATSGPINPSMRVLELDPVTFELLDYEQYRMYLEPGSKGYVIYFILSYITKQWNM